MAASDTNTSYLITGGNRGIGLGLVKALLTRPATTVIASVRSEATRSALESEIAELPKGLNSQLVTIIVDLAALQDPVEIYETFQSDTGNTISRIDVLISNAALVTSMGPSLTTTASDLHAHFQANAIAPLILFQAFWKLMQPAPSPKFISISSSVGSIEQQEPLPGGAYGPSKAALNWITKRLHWELEEEGLVSVAVHPGWVQTAMGQFAADAWGFPGKPPVTVDQSVEGLLKVIDGATRETAGGKFLSFDGSIMKW